MKNFTADDSAWADFLISKVALILASIVLFAALFHLFASFKDYETQKQLDSLSWDFKNAVDKVGAENFHDVLKESPDKPSGEFKEISYCFSEKEAFRTFPSEEDLKIYVSGEYVSLKAECNGRIFSAVRPFTFRVLPFNRSVLQEKLYTRFGTEGTAASPLTDDYSEIKAFIRMLGTEETEMDPEVKISLNKELIYVREDEEVSAFAYVLIYQ